MWKEDNFSQLSKIRTTTVRSVYHQRVNSWLIWLKKKRFSWTQIFLEIFSFGKTCFPQYKIKKVQTVFLLTNLRQGIRFWTVYVFENQISVSTVAMKCTFFIFSQILVHILFVKIIVNQVERAQFPFETVFIPFMPRRKHVISQIFKKVHFIRYWISMLNFHIFFRRYLFCLLTQ